MLQGFNIIPRIEHLVPGEGEESSVGIEGGLEQLTEELSEQTAPVNARLVQACVQHVFTFNVHGSHLQH